MKKQTLEKLHFYISNVSMWVTGAALGYCLWDFNSIFAFIVGVGFIMGTATLSSWVHYE